MKQIIYDRWFLPLPRRKKMPLIDIVAVDVAIKDHFLTSIYLAKLTMNTRFEVKCITFYNKEEDIYYWGSANSTNLVIRTFQSHSNFYALKTFRLIKVKRR